MRRRSWQLGAEIVWKSFLGHAGSLRIQSAEKVGWRREENCWGESGEAGMGQTCLPSWRHESPAQSVKVRLLGWLAADCPGLNAGPQGVYRLWERIEELKVVQKLI